MSSMHGVVLCGGQSTRMGTDKGLLKLEVTNWAQRAAEKLEALKIPVVLSVNAAQLADYSSVFSPSLLITDDLALEIRGPLRGVLSIYKQYPREDLFVLACDMPLMDATLLQQLIEVYKKNEEFEAFVFSNDDEPEPLCAVYTSRALAHTMQLLASKQLVKYSMKFMLNHLNTLLIPLREDQKKYFLNINSPAALNGL